MSNSDIMVSIKCLAYNHEKYIRKMLDGCLMQKTTFKYEIVIHDDASTDGTTEIIKEYEQKYPNIIRPIYQSENQYKKGGINKRFVYPKLRGKYVALCEGDDYWTDSNKLQIQVDYLEAHPDCSFSFHDADIIWENGKYKCHFFPDEYIKCKVYEKHDKRFDAGDLIELGFIPTASIVARRELLINAQSFVAKPVCGDLPQRLSLSLAGDAYYFNRKMSVYRTGNANSVTGVVQRSNGAALKTLNGQIEILKSFDKCSNGLWHEEIEHDIKKRKLRYYIMQQDFVMIKKLGLTKMFWEETTLIAKTKFIGKKYFGSLYGILKIMRNRIKGL